MLKIIVKKRELVTFLILAVILVIDKTFTTYCVSSFPPLCYLSAIFGPIYQLVSVFLLTKTFPHYILSLIYLSFLARIISTGYDYFRWPKKYLKISLLLILVFLFLFFKPIDLEEYNFYDPTGEIELETSSATYGASLFKEITFTTSNKLMYGFYYTQIDSLIFERIFHIPGNKIDGIENIGFLFPDKTQRILTNKEVEYSFNFLEDFENHFSELPTQFYLYKKEKILSLGDMIFLQCQKEAYERNQRTPVFFVPIENFYQKGNLPFTETCYNKIVLDNKVPSKFKEYDVEEANTKDKNAKVMFSFDIESGRYVNEDNKGKNAISQCEDETTSLGLTEEEKICTNADILPFFSPKLGEIENYPWSTGLDGLNEILSYSERYGLPTTLYIVPRDMIAFEILDKEIIERISSLVEKDLVEIGSHSYYHRYLGKNLAKDKEEMINSKEYLENKFKTQVEGMRGPYLSKIENSYSKQAKILKEVGYSYFSHEGEFKNFNEVYSLGTNIYLVSDKNLVQFKDNIRLKDYVLSLDHPWNIGYKKINKNGEIYLKSDSESIDHFRKAVLLSFNEGGIHLRVVDFINVLKEPMV